MNTSILNRKLKSKTVGIVLLLFSTLLLITTFLIGVFLYLFAISSKVNTLSLIPFLLLSILILILSTGGIYIGIRYLRNKGFKKNSSLGTTLIAIGLLYFTYSFTIYILSNLTDNTGGYLKPIFGLIWAIITVPLGLAIKNGVK